MEVGFIDIKETIYIGKKSYFLSDVNVDVSKTLD